MQMVYVESCPDCGCPQLRTETGETRRSRYLAQGCTTCPCHYTTDSVTEPATVAAIEAVIEAQTGL